MTIDHWLQKSVEVLRNKDINSARLDCLILLEDILGKDRAWILAHPDHEIDELNVKTLNDQIKRRVKHEPLAYIRGRSEFFGREFLVTPSTLQPRPETETMIELLLELSKNKEKPVKSVIDVGTGSGCLAITTKLDVPNIEVLATDINRDALEVAIKNAENQKAEVEFIEGNLLEPVTKKTLEDWIILANLPYVPNSHTINEAAMQEPKVAIFGGEDGLDLYRQMFRQIDELSSKPFIILTESLPFQHEALTEIAKTSGFKLSKAADLIQVFSI